MRNAKKTLSLVMIAIFTTFIVLSGLPAGAVTTAAAKAQVTKATALVVKAEAAVKVAAFNPTTAKTLNTTATKEVAKVNKLGTAYKATYLKLVARYQAVNKKIAARIVAINALKNKVFTDAEAAVAAAEKATDGDTVDLVADATALANAQGAVTAALELIVKLDQNSANYKGLMARIDAANALIVKAMDEIAAIEAQKAKEEAEKKAAEEAAKVEAAAIEAAEKAVAAVEAAPLVTAADITAAQALGTTAATAVAAVKTTEKAAAFAARLKVVYDKGLLVLEGLKPATVASVSAVDGTITVTFNKKPLTTPAAADFVVTKAIGTAAAAGVTPTAVTVVSATAVTLTVPAVAPIATTDQSVVYNVTYGTGTAVAAAAYTVAKVPTLAVVSATAINAKQVLVVFNKDLDVSDADTAQVATNYVIGGVALDSAVMQADGKSVILNTTAAMTNNTEYAISVTGVKDDKNATMTAYSGAFTVNDAVVPTIKSITVKGSTYVRVYFTEPVQNAATAANWLFDNAALGAGATLTAAADKSYVTITWSTGLTLGDHTLKLVQNPGTVIVDYAGYAVPATSNAIAIVSDLTVPTVTAVKQNSQTEILVTFSKAVATPVAANFYWNLSGSTADNAYIADAVTKVDDSNYKVTFTTHPLTVGAVSVFTTGVVDLSKNALYGNVAAGIYKSALTVTANAAPVAVSAAAKNDSNVYVYFSTDMDPALAVVPSYYVIKDSTGAVVASGTPTYNSDYKRVTVPTTSAMSGGTYTITVSSVKDAIGTAIATATFSFAVTDTTSPTISGLVKYEGLSFVINFTEPMSVSGSNSILNADNYMFKADSLPVGTTLTALNSNKAVRITLPATSVVAAPDGVTVGYIDGASVYAVADTSGNLLVPASTTINSAVTAVDLAADCISAKIVNSTTVKFVLSKSLSAAYVGDFLINTTKTPLTVALSKTTLPNDTLTFTLASADALSAAATTLQLTTRAATSSTDMYGVKLVVSRTTGAVAANNAIAPILKGIAVIDADHLLVEFSGAIDVSTVVKSDFIITQGTSSWTGGTIITVASATGATDSKYLIFTLGGSTSLAIDQNVTLRTVAQDYLATLGVNTATIAANTTGVTSSMSVVALAGTNATTLHTLDVNDVLTLTFNKSVDTDTIGNVDGTTVVAATVDATANTITIAGLGTFSGFSAVGTVANVTLDQTDNFHVTVTFTTVTGAFTKAAGTELVFTPEVGIKTVGGEAINSTIKAANVTAF